ncbi:hypothetical protein BASA60_001330 [Batrachochytrium salamandrivorans]|nr:hypothetical protein BASA60_001330 [Batrachochytrium salamandrivorans]
MADLNRKLLHLSTQWQDNLAEINRLRNKADELQEAFTSFKPNEERIRFRRLQKENQVLSQLVKQYESTLEVIMGKFRTQTNLIQQERMALRADAEKMLHDERNENAMLRIENTRLAEHLDQCAHVMREVSSSNDEADVAMLVAGLAKENETLRSMLIASLPNYPTQTASFSTKLAESPNGIMETSLPLQASGEILQS